MIFFKSKIHSIYVWEYKMKWKYKNNCDNSLCEVIFAKVAVNYPILKTANKQGNKMIHYVKA